MMIYRFLRRFLWAGFVVFLSIGEGFAFSWQEDTPTLAVLPFISPNDPHYGVYISDRLVSELMFYRDVPVLQRRRFHLMEPDTLATDVMRRIWRMPHQIGQSELNALKQVSKSDWAIIGHVFQGKIGTRTVKIRIVDLSDGQVKWEESMRDDSRWVWVYVARKSGEIALEYMLGKMGFELWDKSLPTFLPKERPKWVGISPFYSDRQLLAGIYNRGVSTSLETNGFFSLRETQLKQASRLGFDARQRIQNLGNTDAVLCGSVISPSEEGMHDDQVAVALRLVDVQSGHILWAGSSGVRHVWRKDRIDQLIQDDAVELINNLAKSLIDLTDPKWTQDDPVDGDGWVQMGVVYLERGLLDQAEKAFLEAEAFASVRALALNGLGLVYARRPTLRSRAIDYFQQAVHEDETFVDAYYHMAKTYMDMGTSQVVEAAQKVLALDPEYVLAYRLLGDWFARGDWYNNPTDDEQAVLNYAAYLKRVPQDVDVVEQLAKVLFRLKEYKKLAPYLGSLANAKLDLMPLLPFAAQLAYKQEKYDTAQQLWQEYLSRLSVEKRDLYYDLGFVLAPEDTATYALLDGSDKIQFDESYWQQRDPDLTTDANERQLEHFRRVWFAQQNFSLTQFPWDRRGMVFIRYGEPDYRSRSNYTQAVTDLAVQQIKEQMFADIYVQGLPAGELGGSVFPVRSLRGMMQRAVSDDARISSYRGEGRAVVHSFDDRSLVPWEAWVYVDIGGGFEVTFTDEHGTGHFDFAPMPTDYVPGIRSLTRLQSYAPETVFRRAIDEMPDRYAYWQEKTPLNFYYDLIDFRGKSGESQLDVFYALRVDEVVEEQAEGEVQLKLSLALSDSVQGQVVRKDVQVALPVRGQHVLGTLLMEGVSLNVAPGRYHLQVKVKDVVGGRVGAFNQTVDIDNYDLSGLKISDLLLASNIIESSRKHRFKRGDLTVIPLPTHAYLSHQELKLYFEIYNLSKNEFGQTRYKITVQVRSEEGGNRLQRLVVKKDVNPEVSLTYEQVGEEGVAPTHLSVNLKNVKSGRNRLVVLIEDLNSNMRVAKETIFIYGN